MRKHGAIEPAGVLPGVIVNKEARRGVRVQVLPMDHVGRGLDDKVAAENARAADAEFAGGKIARSETERLRTQSEIFLSRAEAVRVWAGSAGHVGVGA